MSLPLQIILYVIFGLVAVFIICVGIIIAADCKKNLVIKKRNDFLNKYPAVQDAHSELYSALSKYSSLIGIDSELDDQIASKRANLIFSTNSERDELSVEIEALKDQKKSLSESIDKAKDEVTTAIFNIKSAINTSNSEEGKPLFSLLWSDNIKDLLLSGALSDESFSEFLRRNL